MREGKVTEAEADRIDKASRTSHIFTEPVRTQALLKLGLGLCIPMKKPGPGL